MKRIFNASPLVKSGLLFLLSLSFPFILASQPQTVLNTTLVSGFSNNNGTGTVTFNFQNTNSYPITITKIEGISGTAGAATCEVWLNPTPLNTSTAPPISTANGWYLAATGTFTAVANSSTLTTQVFLNNISIVIPGNTTMGMAVCAYSGTSTYQRYHTMVSPNIPLTTVSGGGCNILMGTNISWGGGIPPTAPSNHPRGWLGIITFVNYKNDASVSAINTPTSPVTPGTYTVTATIKNVGKDTLKTVGLRWSVNGVLQTSPPDWTGALAQNSTAGPITFGTYNFAQGTHIIKAWTVNPNGQLDSNNMNDTATATIISCSPLSGTYIIDKFGTGDFTSFTAAFDRLKNCGISGPVTFRVKTGMYTGQLVATAISGASATNTITFESYNLDSNSVIVTYSAAGTADNFVLQLNGANYYTFRKMTFLATGTTYGRVIEFTTSANNNKILNNVIQTTIGTSSTLAGIYSATSLDHYNTISNNVITGGYYGIYWYGASTTSREDGNIIDGNIIKDFYYYGILCYYQNAVKIRRNTVTNSTASGTVYGIYPYYCYNDVEYSYNKITLKASSTIYALYLSNNVATTALRGKVYNNFISTGGSSTGTVYALYLATTSYHDVSFNSVIINNASTTSRCFYITGGTASTTNVRNNIFANMGGGYAIYTGSATTALGTCNYNNLFTTGTSLGYWTAATANLAAWRTASSKDANSLSINPMFYTTTDLHINNIGLDGMGTAIAGITDDIDGQLRSATPDIGADEFDITYNDAGISSLVSPLLYCPGDSSDVSVMVKNFGNSTLTSVTLNWEINGVAQTPQTYTVSLSLFQESTIFLGKYYFALGTNYNLKFWTSQPNGVSDENAVNDQLIYNDLPSAFSGNYTVGGPGADFLTLGAAVNALKTKGVCGPAVFKINPGIYTERVEIPVILGASATNTIVFDGIHRDSVTITFTGTSTQLATILLNGADFVTFKNMTIENKGTTYSVGVCLMNAADYNTIDNCNVMVDNTTTGTTADGILATSTETSATGYGNNANYTTINNCLIRGGYYGIKLNGSSTSVKCSYNTVSNCVMRDQYYYAIHFYYQDYPRITGNDINQLRYSTNYGIYNYYGGNNPIITDNYVNARNYGIYNYYCSASRIERNTVEAGYMGMYIYQESNSADSTMIVNNMIRQGSNSSYAYGYGIYLYYGTKVNIYHNTIQTDSTYSSPTSYGAIRIYYCYSGIKVKNNILRSFGNLPLVSTDGAGIAEIDYNIYYTVIAGNIVAYWGSTSYTSLISWQLAMPQLNKNSQFLDPALISKYNLHLKPGAPFYKGINLRIPDDNDGDPRCIPIPTIGADEFVHPFETITADFHIDSNICFNAPYTFFNTASANEPKMHKWFVDGVFKSDNLHFTYFFPTAGSNTITLVTQGCSSSDTAVKTIQVKAPATAPVSYFVADKNYVEVYENISLMNLSMNCPQRFKWQISPDSVFDPTVGTKMKTFAFISGNDSSYSPVISFLYSDRYTICLTAYNSFDTGTTYCLNQYVEVKPSATLCIYPFDTREQEGVLYDDGGFTGPYTANKSCGFHIHPCAKEVKVVFKYFDIATDDYVRIYEGTDAKGRPLWDASTYQNGLNNGTKIPNASDTFISRTGHIYIDLVSNASNQGNGFVANWYSVQEWSPKPIASFDTPDTICEGIPVTFKNTSDGVQIEASWDFDNDWFFDAYQFNGENIFYGDGDYKITLVVNSCGGGDTFSRNVYVKTATQPPQFELIASNPRPTVFKETVNLSVNTLVNCVDSAIWDITPKSYSLLTGNLNKSKTLILKFNDTVCYDFNVIGTYNGLADTMNFPCFIKPIFYCNPVVTTLSNDIGISKVILGSINNSSAIGETEYTDYTTSKVTDLERGGRCNFTISRNTNFNPVNRKIWIDLNNDGIYDDNSELMAYESSSFSRDWKSYFTLPANQPYGLFRLRIGVSYGNSDNLPCGPNYYGEFEDYMINIIDDISKPVITLKGPQFMSISECDRSFKDPGASAFDNVDGDISNSIIVQGGFNPNLAGTYIITYDVTDAAGNAADQVSRTIFVYKETVPPQISLNGNSYESLQVFGDYDDAGYTAIDTCSGISHVDTVYTVNTAVLGKYTVKYTAYDMEGNYASVSRTVEVFDTIAPVISSPDKDTIVMEAWATLAQPAYTVSDNYYDLISVNISGTFYDNFPNGEASDLGIYTLVYTATDGSGNNSSISFFIKVVDTQKPFFALKGGNLQKICRFDTLIDPGYILTDNFDLHPKVSKSGTYVTDYLVYMNVGYYDLIYTVEDQSGNTNMATRLIVVSDQDSCFSSTENDIRNERVILFPNPGNGYFNILFNFSSSTEAPVTVINSIGEIIFRKVGKFKAGEMMTINGSDWKPGIYYIRIESGETPFTLKYNLVK